MELSLQGCFYIGFSVFYVYVIYHGMKILFEIRDLLKQNLKVQKTQPIKKKITK